ncbi:MAG: sigma-70 family RNA polymerase sigma factor [Candidatus Dormibacteraeota bacterium]|nr:sigma-70 family RNA polymerase sigma factor [Candidatus Dormibacteraeota bacterium]MBV9524649.1 sigma-70 family RNA polymerase sigma factor [Candidatus Dormibacteraeota bacterium]
MQDATTLTGATEADLDAFRRPLTGFCYRMLGSPFEAEDAVQETLLRAWRSLSGFDGRSSLSTWLHRIATNVCVDMLKSRQRRAMPMDFGPAQEPVETNLHTRPEITWVEPIPGTALEGETDPADVAVSNESIKLAFIAALQHLPPRQRAALILCEVLRWRAAEVAELLETSVASVNSALQRARATLDASGLTAESAQPQVDPAQTELLQRYVDAFQRYDLEALTAVISADAKQSMPPYDMWLSGRDDIFAWWWGPGIGCKGSRLLPAPKANGSVAYGQYKPSPSSGYDPWALQVIEVEDGSITQLTFFLDTKRFFPLFGLPDRLES